MQANASVNGSRILNCYRILWETATIQTDPPPASRGLPEPLILFDHDSTFFNHLRQSQTQAILVKPAPSFVEEDENVFGLNCREADDYERFVTLLQRRDINPAGVLHLGNYEDPGDRPEKPEILADSLVDGHYVLAQMARALSQRRIQGEMQWIYLFQAAPGRIRPLQSSVAGLLHIINQENPYLKCRAVSSELDKGRSEMLLDLIKTEFAIFDAVDVRCAGKARYVKRIRPMVPTAPRKVPLKTGGTYLVVDGNSHFGVSLAEYLLQKYSASVMLSGQRQTDPHSTTLTSGPHKNGGMLGIMYADSMMATDLTAVLAATTERFGVIDGVFLVSDPSTEKCLPEKDLATFQESLASSIFRIIHLDQITREAPLDFFVMVSPSSSVLKHTGQGAEVVCGRFMEEYAAYRNQLAARGKRPGKSIAINWPFPLASNRAADASRKPFSLTNHCQFPVTTSQELNIFSVILAEDARQVMVCNGSSLPTALYGQMQPRPVSLPKDYEEGKGVVGQGDLFVKTEHYLKSLLAEETKLPLTAIQSKASFESYGINSLIVMNLSRKIDDELGKVPRSLFFQYTNLHDLTGYFVEQHTSTLQRLFSPGEDAEGTSSLPEMSAQPAARSVDFPKARKNLPLPGHIPLTVKSTGNTAVAIIGVSGRYPMANNLAEFWRNLTQGRDCVTEIPADRWDYKKYFDPDKGKVGKTNCKWGGFLQDLDRFDAHFFGIPPEEAEMMDPQQRLFLETAWQCIEDAGYTIDKLKKIMTDRIGVFVGSTWQEYMLSKVDRPDMEIAFHPSAQHCNIPNRVSYHFGFSGPSLAVDTASSSSLSAIHLAYRSVQEGECAAALAGGVNVSLHPNKYQLGAFFNMISSRQHTRSFGAGGDGYVPGEGVGAVLLKPLNSALRDGDHIYAVIKASAMNHGGKGFRYAVPNPAAQTNLIIEAIERSGIHPETISYIEAHALGAALGDAIEIEALTRAFRKFTDRRQFCAIGSCKPNIGHLEAGAGIAQLTKVLLQMKNRLLVPSLYSQPRNPHIDFDDTPFTVQETLAPWFPASNPPAGKGTDTPRRAGISAFGATGTNVHMILEASPPVPETDSGDGPWIIVLSAENNDRLRASANNLAAFLNDDNLLPTLDEHAIKLATPLAIRDGLRTIVSALVDIHASEVSPDDALGEYLTDPESFILLSEKIKERYDCSFLPELLRDIPSLSALSHIIQEQCDGALRIGKNSCQNSSLQYLPYHRDFLDMDRLAYTLQTGRQAMASRLAIVVRQNNDLSTKLRAYIQGESDIPNAYCNNGKAVPAVLAGTMEVSCDQADIASLVRDKRFNKIALMWVSGIDIEWSLLYRSPPPRLVPLPPYPFAGGRYRMANHH